MQWIIGLGSVGHTAPTRLQNAIEIMDSHAHIHVLAHSQWYWNAAVGNPSLEKFCNGAAAVETSLSPEPFWRVLRAIEWRFGRLHRYKNGLRTLDLDILCSLDGQANLQNEYLTVPHPRLMERSFALIPALEVMQRCQKNAPPQWTQQAQKLQHHHTLECHL